VGVIILDSQIVRVNILGSNCSIKTSLIFIYSNSYYSNFSNIIKLAVAEKRGKILVVME
jgi:hypothetical protein